MYYVYIIQSQKDNKFYTGLTKNLGRRLQEHNSGKVKSTKGRRPFNLIYHEKYSCFKMARGREKFFKSGTGRDFRKNEISKNIPA